MITVLLHCTDKPLGDRVCRAVVVEDYSPTASDELGLVKGDTVEVMKKMSYGWWKGRMGSKVGIFPSQNVKLVEHQQQQEEVEQETGNGTYSKTHHYTTYNAVNALKINFRNINDGFYYCFCSGTYQYIQLGQ